MIKYTIEKSDEWIDSQERILREFYEFQQEQMVQLLQNICNEYKVTMKLLNSTILEDADGNEIESGKIYEALWNIIQYDECNRIGVLGNMILKPEDNGVDYPDGEWADGWKERSDEGSVFSSLKHCVFDPFNLKELKMLEKNRIYIVRTEEYGNIESVWDGEDFYPNENINAKFIEDLVISGVVIGDPFNNKFKILSIRAI